VSEFLDDNSIAANFKQISEKMKKKSRPSEIITDTKVLKDINYINEIESLILNKRGESGKSKKTSNEKYFILDIYKNQNASKSSKSILCFSKS
jgi:hypothetical protein